MKSNVGGVDRILRIVIGAALIVWAALLSGPAWAWVGVVPLVTGIIRLCPLYSVLGFNTCPTQNE